MFLPARAQNFKPAPSLTTTAYHAGITEFYARHYKKALKSFQQAQSLYPGHPFAAKYISDSQTAISQGKDQSSSGAPVGLFAGIGGAVVLIVGGLAVFLGVRSKRSKAPAADPAYAAWPVPPSTNGMSAPEPAPELEPEPEPVSFQ